MNENKKDILILGFGSDILMDSGIGPKLIRFLNSKLANPRISYDNALVGGLDLIEIIRDYKKVIIIDSTKTLNGIPGSVYYYTPGNFKETLHISLVHDISFATALQLGKELDIQITENINIIAIEIVDYLTLGNNFSPQLQEKYPEIKKEVEAAIKKMIQ
jgi:hydrogenase maturation protease